MTVTCNCLKDQMKKFALAMLATVLTLPAHAAAIAQLKAFVSDTKTLSASFTQVVSAKNKQEEVSGSWKSPAPANSAGATTSPTSS
jgi:outer membrane lipoprotein-sorting protein